MPSLWWSTLRSAVLACLIVANAIVTSAGVWHLSLSEYGGRVFALDIYVIIESALALLGISSIVFFEYALPDPHLVPLWFETTWAAILFLAEFAAAVAVSSLGSDMMCPRVADLGFPLDACVANKLLAAFLWISTIIVLFYVGALISFIIRARGKTHSPWRNFARNLYWSHPVDCLPSVPASPTSRPRFQSTLIVAPQPRPARRPLDAFRSGLGSEYEIEHYQPPAEVTLPTLAHNADPSSSFYADHLKTKLSPVTTPTPLTPAPSPPPVPAEPAPIHTREERKSIRPLPQFPPPLLGDWPRSDAMVRESTKKRGKRREVLPPENEVEQPLPPVPLPALAPAPVSASPPTPPPEPVAAPVAPAVTRPPPVSMSSSPPRSRPFGPLLSGERRISGDMSWH